jgi:hypothetical protein
MDADFADLLARYPALATWLSEQLQSGRELQAEELLPRFLAECSELGIPDHAYPFAAKDQGLEALRSYVQAGRAELAASLNAPTPRRTDLAGEQEEPTGAPQKDISRLPTQEVEAVTPSAPASDQPADEEAPTEKIPVVKANTAAQAQAAEHTTGQAGNEARPPLEDEVAETSTPDEQDSSISERETALVPTVSPQAPRPEISEQETARMAALAPEEATPPVHTAETDKPQAQTTSAPPSLDPSSPRRKHARRLRTRRQRILYRTLLLLILATILIPAALLVNFGVSAYTTYHQLSDQAHNAVNQLLDVKTTFSSSGSGASHLNSILDSAKLQRAQKDFIAAEHDFQQLQNQLRQSDTLKTVATYFPHYRTALSSALAASVIGVDIAKVGQIATSNAIQLAPNFSGPLLAASNKPLVTQSVLTTIGTTIGEVMPLLRDIQGQAAKISLDSLPISATEKTQVEQVLQQLPQVLYDLEIVHNLLGSAGWLLGVDHPRTFLVQTMDRAELRGTGGFTGQYGELTINGGRVAPFSLTDISLLEYTDTSVTQGQLAPEQYRSWWPFANWGLRDSNISADFPTSAQVAINLYKQETGHQVDGLISFTPIMVEHILSILGPVQVPGYNVTVTAQNLEDLLHYYQLDNAGILKQIQMNQGATNTSTSERKRFTSYVASLVLARVRAAPASELLAIAHQVLDDLQTKDLQVYFTDATAEDVLIQYGYAGQLDRSTTHDGLFVVQQNLSASKASQYVQTIMHDTVSLDSKGGATHLLQIRLVYNQAGPVYGYDTYYDYLRVYVPPNSRLISGDGFSSGTPLCGGSYGSCPVDGPYPDGELVCPAGQYQPGASPPSLSGSNGATWQPLQTLGGPTNTTSDEPGRAMYGGWVIVPKNCTMTVTLSWYVPPLSQHGYSLLVQRQAGTFPELDLSILPDAADCATLGTTGLHFDGILLKDTSFTPPASPPAKQGTQNCYPRQGV